MKKNYILIAAGVVLAFVVGYIDPIGIVHAQGSAPAGSSVAFSAASGSTCQGPTVGATVLCVGPAGVQISANNAAFTTLGAQGPAGPQGLPGVNGQPGPAGQTGATGAQGPPGTPGSIQATISCSGLIINGTSIQLTGCH